MRSSASLQHLRDDGLAARGDSVELRDRFPGLSLSSHLQPIFSLAHQRAVGYEGLIRCTDRNEAALAPLKAFARCRSETDAVILDRMCRALHLRNFAARDLGEAWLCINLDPRVFRKSESHDTFFGKLLDMLSFPANRIVVVIPKTVPDEQKLKSWVDHYRSLGCMIALNDFAAGRVWRLRPDFVILDRSAIAEVGDNPAARAMLPRIVSLAHDAGAMVILQGIESGAEAVFAMDSDADFVQGYYFAYPHPAGEPREFCDRIEEMLAATHRAHSEAVAKAQVEMMERVQAEQQSIAERVARAAAGNRIRLPAAADRAEPFHHLPSQSTQLASLSGRRFLSR